MKKVSISQNIDLMEENKILRERLRKLEDGINTKEEARKKFTWWISKTVSVLGLIYLIAYVFLPSSAKNNRIQNAEIFIFAIILMFNSGLLEKLEDFSIDGTRVQAKFQSLKEKQEKQEEAINRLSQVQEIALQFALRGIIDQHEIKHLKGLKEAEDHNSEYIVKYGFYIKTFEKEMWHLIALNFLYKKANISDLVNELKSDEKADLRKYVAVTQDGRRYLSLRRELGIEEPESERPVSANEY